MLVPLLDPSKRGKRKGNKTAENLKESLQRVSKPFSKWGSKPQRKNAETICDDGVRCWGTNRGKIRNLVNY